MESGFVVAIFLAVVTFLMPFFSRELRRSGSIKFGYWFVITLHQVVAFLNAHLFAIGLSGTFGATGDANVGFHRVAKELALHGELSWRGTYLSVPLSLDSFMKGGAFYYEMLGSVYKLFGASHLLGDQFSVLAFVFSCIIFLKVLRQLRIEHYNGLALIFFGALPSMVFLGSITLREPYEVLFFMMTVYFGLQISMNRKLNIRSVFLMVMSALLMAAFHKVLVVIAVMLIFLFLIWCRRPISRFGNIKKLHIMTMMVTPFLLFCIMFLSDGRFGVHGSLLTSLVGSFNNDVQNLGQLISGWREMLLRDHLGRANYEAPFDSSSFLMIIFSFLKMISYYLFAPFPWMVRNSMDIGGLLESMLRMTLIYFSVKDWCKACGEKRRLLGLMLILYFSISFLWAVGTTNYGTAMRHNMMAWWIIVITGVPPLMAKLQHIWLDVERRLRLNIQDITRLKM